MLLPFIQLLPLLLGTAVGTSVRQSVSPSVPPADTTVRQSAPSPLALERRLADQLGARLGDTLDLGTALDSMSHRGVVVAIYQPAADPSTVTKGDYHLRLHLPDLASILGMPDRVDRFGVELAPGVPADSAANEFNRVAFGYRAFPSAAIASESSQTFVVVSRFHTAISVISIVASAVFLLCIMLLKVEERRRDAAVMRFTGVRRRTIFGALLLEALLVAGLGSIIGIGLAYLAAAATNWFGQRYFETTLIFAFVTPGIVLFSVGLSLLLGAGAGALAAWRLVRASPLVLWGRG